MATCKTCGGDNAVGKTRCQYCDQPLADARALELDWEVVSPTGARGRGRARLHASAGFDSQAARGVIEAAFILATTVLGPDAGPPQVQAAMAERLPGLLPAGTVLESITVDAVSAFVLVAGAGPGARDVSPVAQPAGGGSSCSAGCVALALALCCLTSGVSSFAMSFAMMSDVDTLRSARIVTPKEAVTAEGFVALEAATVSAVASDAPLAPDGARCLWFRLETTQGKPQVARWASSFELGGVVVRPGPDTTFDDPQPLPAGTDRPEYTAILADRPVTVLGRVNRGVIEGPGVTVSPRPSRDVIADDLQHAARAGRGGGVACSLVGLVLFAFWLMAGRARAQREA